MVDDIEQDPEVLEATGEMYDQLVTGAFYEQQAIAKQWLREQAARGRRDSLQVPETGDQRPPPFSERDV